MIRVMVLLALGLAALPPTTPPAATAAPPNIIFILTDDLDASAVQFMPSLLALVRDQGVEFTNFFITTPVCCPSRSSILRGQFAHNHGVLRNEGKDGGFETFYALKRERSTIGVWLRQAGTRPR